MGKKNVNTADDQPRFDHEDFFRRLEELVQQNGGQQAVSHRLGTSRQALNRTIKQSVMPRLPALVEMAHELGVDLHWLATGESRPIAEAHKPRPELAHAVAHLTAVVRTAETSAEELRKAADAVASLVPPANTSA